MNSEFYGQESRAVHGIRRADRPKWKGLQDSPAYTVRIPTLMARRDPEMKYRLGILLQFVALAMLPSIIIFQLFYGFKLIVMPISLLCGICVFSIGTALRESL